MVDYVSQMRDRLYDACAVAKESLSASQQRMKHRYDRKAVSRDLNPGDQVLALLPVPGSSLSACFSGPYVIERKICETDYVVKTPDRKRSSHVCHVNMLKAYHVRGSPVGTSGVLVHPAVVPVAHVEFTKEPIAED